MSGRTPLWACPCRGPLLDQRLPDVPSRCPVSGNHRNVFLPLAAHTCVRAVSIPPTSPTSPATASRPPRRDPHIRCAVRLRRSEPCSADAPANGAHCQNRRGSNCGTLSRLPESLIIDRAWPERSVARPERRAASFFQIRETAMSSRRAAETRAPLLIGAGEFEPSRSPSPRDQRVSGDGKRRGGDRWPARGSDALGRALHR
jgi:hypothetical protein